MPSRGGPRSPAPDADLPLDDERLGRALTATSTSFVLVVDREGRVVRFNRACEELCGVSFEKVRGQPVWEVLKAPDDRQDAEGTFRRLIAGEPWHHHETVHTTMRGHRYVLWSNSVLFDDKGRVEYLISTGNDITDRRHAELALHEERGRLEGILASAMDAIITVDATQRVRFFNAAAEKMFGWPAGKAIGQPLDDFIPVRFREGHREHVRRFGEEGTTTRAMGHLRPLAALRTSGEEFPIEASISQVKVGGEVLFTAIVRDITARVRAEQEVREAESRFRNIFDHAAVGIVMADPRGTIIEANSTFEKMVLYSDAELRGLSIAKVTHPLDVRPTLENLEAVVNDPTRVIEFEKRYIRKDGKGIWARVILSAVRGQDQGARYVVKMVEDITPRKRAEARARRARKEGSALLQRFNNLTDREQEVFWLMAAGKPTKNIASELGASPKTIEVHRARVMEKMQVDSIAALAQCSMRLRPLVQKQQPR
jgi:PAS domain S-box-containing protein